VRLDGTDIYQTDSPDLTLISPVLEMEVSSAGSLTFTLPPGHVFYDNVHLMTSTVEVLEDNTPIWSGRPTEISTDYWGRRKVYCEGALAYLNDSVQPYQEYDQIGLWGFFDILISNHNNAVPASRRFKTGNITVTDKTVYRKLEYNTTMDALREMCLNARGGYLFVRRENGVNYLDWLKTMPKTGTQAVQFGYNLLDLNQQISGADIITQILPVGDNDEDGNPITVASVNSGSDIVANADAVAQFGAITKSVQFSGISEPSKLLSEAQEYLENVQLDALTIQADAADLYYLDNNIPPIQLGQMVQVQSAPHHLSKAFPVTRLKIMLDSARKNVTLNTLQKPTLTEIVKETAKKSEGRSRSGGSSGGGSGGGGSGGGGSGGGSGDGWIHQIDGVTVSGGTINFVTVAT
jgi:uncharacterized membrane protein YgcG